MKRVLIFILLLPTLSFANSVVYSVDGKKYEGFIKRKAKDSPTILILHDWDGITDYEIKRANMLFDIGYSVVVADLFGQGIRPTANKDKMQHTGELYKDREKLRKLMKGALEQAKKSGLNINNLVVVGYCFGGAASLELARSGHSAKAFVSFHGGLKTPEGQNYKNTKSKILVYHGTADDHISMQEFAALAVELNTNKIDHEMLTYGNAPHGFTVFDSPAYRKDIDQRSWSHFVSFLMSIQ